MKICLVNPPSPFLINEKVFPPLGLLTLSAVMKQAGYDNIEFLDLAGKSEVPKDIKADIFFITATTPQVEIAKDVMRELWKNNRTSKFVVGGPHATVMASDFFSFDAIVEGEGEEAVLRVLEDYPNLKKVYFGEPVQNLDEIPFPDRDIIDIKEYANNYKLGGEPTTTYVTSRGCSYGKCAFCCRMTNGVRYRSAKNIYEEVMLVKRKYNIKGAMFFDDEFTANQKRLIEFCDLIKDEGIKWRCMSRVNSINDKIVSEMRKAGCIEVGIGIESADPKILRTISKGIKIERAKKAIKTLKDNGIRVKTFFILGLPGESKESIRLLDKFIEKTKPDDVDLTVLSVMPGSDIYNHPEKYDIKFNPHCKAWYKGKPGEYAKVCRISTSNLSFEEIVNARDELERKYKPVIR